MNKHVSRADLYPPQEAALPGGHTLNRDGSLTMADGSMVISPTQLMAVGNGDILRGRRELRSFLTSEQARALSNGPTKKPTTVRLGIPNDEEAILALLMMDLKENAEFIAPIDEDKVKEAIEVGTRMRGGFAGVIDGVDGVPIAVIIIHPEQWGWSQGWYFCDKYTFVHPDHRQSHHFSDLCDFAKWCVDEQTKGFGYRVYLLTGVMGTHRLWSKISTLRRKARQVGAAFCYPDPVRGGRS